MVDKIIDELIVSLLSDSDRWKLTYHLGNYNRWEPKGKGNTNQFRTTYGGTSEQFFKDHHQLLTHDSGICLKNYWPERDDKWTIIEPQFISLGFFARRRLTKAIRKLKLTHFTDRLYQLQELDMVRK